MIGLSEEGIQSWDRQNTGAPGPNGSQLRTRKEKVLKEMKITTLKDTWMREQNRLHVDDGENFSVLGNIRPDTAFPSPYPSNTVTLFSSLKIPRAQEAAEEAGRAWLMWFTARSCSWTRWRKGKEQCQRRRCRRKSRRSSYDLGWRGPHSTGVQLERLHWKKEPSWMERKSQCPVSVLLVTWSGSKC